MKYEFELITTVQSICRLDGNNRRGGGSLDSDAPVVSTGLFEITFDENDNNSNSNDILKHFLEKPWW